MPNHLSARYAFRAGGLPDDALAAVDFVGDEAVSQPFRFVVNLVSTDPDIDFDAVVNQKASLLMLPALTRIRTIEVTMAEAVLQPGSE